MVGSNGAMEGPTSAVETSTSILAAARGTPSNLANILKSNSLTKGKASEVEGSVIVSTGLYQLRSRL